LDVMQVQELLEAVDVVVHMERGQVADSKP
jgi:hypothetical protein